METSVSLLERLTDQPTDPDWQRLFELYQPLLRAWALRAGATDADADDLVQETLTVVVREVAAFDRNRAGAFRAWLRGVLANRLRGFFRARRSRPVATGETDLLDRLDELEAPESALSCQWDREHDLYVAARAMKMVQGDFAAATWEAFRRQVLDGAAPAVVAAEMGLSQNSVLLAKSRVLKRLREEVAEFVDC
ncbi:MAG: sigma-70 family RNA polymerase sigma factor [Gemmataceae bacterium]